MKNIQLEQLSIIVPVYNRPVEIKELLESLVHQTLQGVEIVIVEDGSDIKSDAVIEKYSQLLNISYYFKPNSGPGQSRNYGFERAKGDYCIFLDSDCVLPTQYCETILKSLQNDYTDSFGGPDKAHEDFTTLQKAINYSMTSFFTTGGIRGSSEKLEKFHPRSFNMGYSRAVYDKTKGFAKMRFGEDIDMSIRIIKNNFKTKLIKEAFVYHKRRTNFRQFFKQIFNSGIARINLYKRHPKSLKIVHFAPMVFVLASTLMLLGGIFICICLLYPLILYVFLIFIDSLIKNRSLTIALLSIITSFIQLFAYGVGFIKAIIIRLILNKSEFSAFEKTFYK